MKKITDKELKVIRTAATYLHKAADIIYEKGDGNLYANGLSEKAYDVCSHLRRY